MDPAWGGISQGLLLPPLSAPGPILVMHIGTCQGLASQRPEGAPAGDFKSPNAFQKGTKTFCLTKASTGEEQPSPFLFKSLYFPAGWPGHSLSLFFFFPIINGPSCNTQGKKNHLPGLGRGRVAAAAAWLASCRRQRRLQPPAPTGRGPGATAQSQGHSGSQGKVREVSASPPNLLLPLGAELPSGQAKDFLKSLFV